MGPERDAAAEPVVTALDHVYYWTSDMDRAVRFYTRVLGLRMVRREGSQWAEFDLTGPRLALHGAVDGHAVAPGGAAAVFEVRDLDVAMALLTARGVAFDHQGDVQGYARFASFRDPDGNTLQVIEYVREA